MPRTCGLGPSGAGKTTALKVLYGKAKPDDHPETRINVLGYDPRFQELKIKTLSGVVPLGWSLLTPFVGFLTGVLFGALGLVITSFVKSINHFNFFFTGVLSPMFFFSGVAFPIENLPAAIRPISEILPLTHPVRITRALALGQPNPLVWFDLLYVVTFILVVGWIALWRLEKKLID